MSHDLNGIGWLACPAMMYKNAKEIGFAKKRGNSETVNKWFSQKGLAILKREEIGFAKKCRVAKTPEKLALP